jgi:vitamin B12/bleomycin/antimicrobial peptide transport system ATP-binding/permease protein
MAERSDQHMIRHFLFLAARFWTGSTRRIAWLLTTGLVACLVVNMLLALAVNLWNKFFFDALQVRDQTALLWSIGFVIVLGALNASAAVALIQVRMRLQLRWRQWLTRTLVERWLSNLTMHPSSSPVALDNPEARIAEDGRLSIELLVDLFSGVFNTLLVSLSFILVLFYVGGSITLGGLTVPGYLVLAVLMYTGVTSYVMYGLGWPLVARVEEKAAGEGNFRYALTRARQNTGPDHDGEKAELNASLKALVGLWIAVIKRQSRMAILIGSNSVLSPVIPLLLCAPKYLSGDMTLGDLMQAATAFMQVHTALNWLADNALSLANWSASARRVAALDMHYHEEEPELMKRSGGPIGNSRQS